MLNCFSCRGEGQGTWCAICTPDVKLDAFGYADPEGRGAWMMTYSGVKFYPLAPRHEDIKIEDIAVGLSRVNRYGGQTVKPYSVAEHSIIVSELATRFAISNRWSAADVRNISLLGLLHDADEAYIGDMPRPLKHEPSMCMDKYREVGKRLTKVILEAFGVEPTEVATNVIEAIDKRLVLDEVSQVMRLPEEFMARHSDLKPTRARLRCLPPSRARSAFLAEFRLLRE